ncbi:gametogenetin-binding protein 2-like [Leptopilina heterotoma]|uniref:gametogenetin-binding protein 2-like n=1 Tax=Leptopilina heterotoma TaxID=63436 RepID=UPI001CA9955D|nr:gametogenetin-binding protein 2-like [Leptopilina heterotoma]
MAKLVDIWHGDSPTELKRRQMPLDIDENLTLIMDANGLGAICDSPLVRGKELEDFTRKLNTLTKEELKSSFEVTCKDFLSILGQTIPCVGCRKSAERLFFDLLEAGHPVLDPLMFTTEYILTLKDEVLESPQMLCTILHKHSARLSSFVEKQTRSKKSHRCALHTLEVQRMRPPPNACREVWECMKQPCRQEITLIESERLDATLETYLRKHRFCSECRTKVLLASSLLMTDADPSKEKGFVPTLYAGIKRCTAESHVHLPINTEYIHTIIGRAQPEIIGRERHAKTLEIAQEEVVTCLGICVAERLLKIYRRLKEAETICKVLAAVAVEALSRNFEMAVEAKQGVTKLELLYEELTRKEIAKQQRQEKLRLKRKKKKERRFEAEEKENTCECSSERSSKETCTCSDLKPVTQSMDRNKLQVLDPKNKGPPTCKCPDCLKKSSTEKTQNSNPKKSLANSNNNNNSSSSNNNNNNNNNNNVSNKKHEKDSTKKKTSGNKMKKNKSEARKTNNESSSMKIVNEKKELKLNSTLISNDNDKKLRVQIEQEESVNVVNVEDKKVIFEEEEEEEEEEGEEEEEEEEEEGVVEVNQWNLPENSVDDLTNVWLDRPNNMWTEMKEHIIAKMTDRNCRSSSEHSSRDRGYSSENYVSSGSFSCTPEGSDVACIDALCNHDENCGNRLSEKLLSSNNVHSNSSLRIHRCEGPTLMQMLEDSNSEDEGTESYIPMEDVMEFQSKISQILEKRQELREKLKNSFEMLCNHRKPFIPH